MIVTIEGTLQTATPVSAVINCGGLGYRVNIPVTTAQCLPQLGQKTLLHTHVVYREDSQNLYGFSNEEERDFFILLIEKVSGVGPKVAISMMSKLSIDSLVHAITNSDTKLLAKTPGIGAKTAERVVVELKDKLAGFSSQNSVSSIDTKLPNNSSSSHEQDALLALAALGYKNTEASKAIKRVLDKASGPLSTEEIIRLALG